MPLLKFLLTCILDSELHFDKTHGIIYQPMANVNIYTEVKRTNVNILIKSPRKIFRVVLDEKNCGLNKNINF